MRRAVAQLDRWFAPFEGTREPYAVAIVRIAFFLGLALHFFPSLIWLDDGYARGVVRTDDWSHWLHVRLWKIPPWALRAGSIATMAACVMGMVGFRPRIAAIVGFVGCYAFASFNGLHLNTLALLDAWAILLLWSVCGAGTAVWSVDAALRHGKDPAREPRLLASLILFQVLLAVFFSGVEKLIAGWPGTNEMKILLSYPEGFIVRDWVAGSAWLRSDLVTTLLTWMTVAVELGTPILLLFRRTRVAALIVFELFFLGIIVMLEVPPLFYFVFAGGALLALDDDQVAAIARRAPWSRRRSP